MSEYTPIPGDYRCQQENEGDDVLVWQWRDGAWEFTGRYEDASDELDFLAYCSWEDEEDGYAYWRPARREA